MANLINDAKAAHDFIVAGNSKFTVKSLKTGDQITFRVSKSDDGKVFFVSVKTKGDEDKSFSYLGTLPGEEPETFVRLTTKSNFTIDAKRLRRRIGSTT